MAKEFMFGNALKNANINGSQVPSIKDVKLKNVAHVEATLDPIEVHRGENLQEGYGNYGRACYAHKQSLTPEVSKKHTELYNLHREARCKELFTRDHSEKQQANKEKSIAYQNLVNFEREHGFPNDRDFENHNSNENISNFRN